MNSKKQLSLSIKFKAGALVNNQLFSPLGKEGFEWLCPPQPFGPLKFDPTKKEIFSSPVRQYQLVVEKEFAPKEFFDAIKQKWKSLPDDKKGTYISENDFSMEVNAWLAIVEHFGLEVDYDDSFMRIVRNCVPEILQHAYRLEKGSVHTTDRFFRKMHYGNEGFRNLFTGFLNRHKALTF